MSSKIFFVGIGIFSLILIIGSYFLLSKQEPKQDVKIISYSLSDKEKPTVEISEDFTDFGKIKVSDTKVKEFTIKNAGSKSLQISDISSSCGCTTGQIIYNGQESKEFSMHSQSDYAVEINPNTEAKVKVTYRPFIMPVYGLVEREVYMSTNDPQNKKVVFKVKAFVQ